MVHVYPQLVPVSAHDRLALAVSQHLRARSRYRISQLRLSIFLSACPHVVHVQRRFPFQRIARLKVHIHDPAVYCRLVELDPLYDHRSALAQRAIQYSWRSLYLHDLVAPLCFRLDRQVLAFLRYH